MNDATYEAKRKELKRAIKNTTPNAPERKRLQEELKQLDASRGRNYDLSPWQESYLSRLFQLTDQLPLSGIDRNLSSSGADSRLRLDAVYTALLTLQSEQQASAEALREGRGEARRLSALEQVGLHRHLVLLGEPGSGKSTFVKFTALCLAGELLGKPEANLDLLTEPLPQEENERNKEREPEAQRWEQGALFPILVILRDFAATFLSADNEEGRAVHLWNFLEHELKAAMLEEHTQEFRTFLQEHDTLLLLDGLDEVPEASQRRDRIKQVVEDFARLFPKCRIVVTSRTYAYQRQEWQLRGFRDTVLASFSRPQIRCFIEQWYEHLTEIRGLNPEDARGRAELLKRVIFQSERLYGFAERPLLLTLMASLHAWRGGSLPEKREELYNDSVELLLDWWESPKIVRDKDGKALIAQDSLSELLKVGKESVREVLNDLAFHVHKDQKDLKGTADIPQIELVDRLMRVHQSKDLQPARLIEYLSDRAGLLVPRADGVFSFPHRTFQEYLAACYLTDEEYPDKIAELACKEPNRWREAALLAGAKAARGTASAVWHLAGTLCCQRLDECESSEEEAWGALLAGQALIESARLHNISKANQIVVTRIQEWLIALLCEEIPQDKPFPSVERALAGKILARLGDPRLGVSTYSPSGRCPKLVEGWILPDIEWCPVIAGEFLMGSDPEKDRDAELWGGKSEFPQHSVTLMKYQLARFPVTNAQFQTFIDDRGYQTREYWSDEGWQWKEEEEINGPEHYSNTEFHLPNHPVVGVSWYEASAFCLWLTRRLRETGDLSDKQEIRLPTEAEWEKAARGTDGRIYPWGDGEMTPELGNYDETDLGVTSAMGCFSRGASPYGCEEMAGNVYEWCRDWYDSEYYEKSPAENPSGPASGSERVLRGGYWGNFAEVCRAANRLRLGPGNRSGNVGFRLLRT